VNRNDPPLSVIIVACVYLAVGTIGFAYHFRELLASQRETIWIELTEVLAVVCGVCLLRRHNWARWLAVAWIAFHVVLSAFHSLPQFAIHALFCALIAWALFHPGANRYFRGAPIEPPC
jgi:hypothetical protein